MQEGCKVYFEMVMKEVRRTLKEHKLNLEKVNMQEGCKVVKRRSKK